MSAVLDHAGHHHPNRTAQGRALWLALLANAALMGVEVAGGLAFHSLALLAEAAHLLSDVAGLAIALVAERLVDRPATAGHSFGLQRAEVLGAQANGLILLVAAGGIMVEAFRRIGHGGHVAGGGVIAVAVAGLAINAGSAVVLARAEGHSLNMRGAVTHMAVDAVGSIGVIVAGVAVLAWSATWADPAVSIVLALLVLWAAWGLLRDTTHVLLEGAPRGLDPDAVTSVLAADPDVELVHHLHLWNLASDVPALSAHVVLRGEPSLHEAQESGERLKLLLSGSFGVQHATLELECHPCAEPDHA